MYPHHSLSKLLITCAVLALLLSACQTANPSGNPAPGQPSAATLTPAAPTQAPAQAAKVPATTTGEISLDLSGVAQGQTVEIVPAVPGTPSSPYWEAAPQYRRVTLQGYPVTIHTMKPQIFIYPVADLLKTNEMAGKVATGLEGQLKVRQPVDPMPFLPLNNARQVMFAQVQFLDFKNGKGERFLTQFGQGPVPVNNLELIYTFQGLTSDGKYYIAAVLPVTHPDLPATNNAAANQNDFQAGLAKSLTLLGQQPVTSFTPDLAKLDALIKSIEIK
jgi:hypothetical protein